MKRIAEPWWIFLVNTLPLILFMIIMAGEYSVVRTLLPTAQKEIWLWFALTLFAMMLITVFFAVFMLARRRKVPALWALGSLLLWIAWIYIYGMNIETLIPGGVPAWMMSANVLLYAGAFLMPSLGYYLLLLVVKFTENTENQALWVNFMVTIAIPLAGYFFVQVIFPFWQPVETGFLIHAFVVVVILATLTFLFFLVRGFYIIAAKRTAHWRKFGLAWKIPFALILPVFGLLLNNGIVFRDSVQNMEGIFGDFNDYWFYALAVINGIVLCLPNLQRVWYRIVLLALRSVTFAYTVYFLLVFLPFLPLSLVAIVVFGTGVLMLTPLILFIIHINELIEDVRFLAYRYHKAMIWTAAGLCFLVIPAAVTVSFLKDRRVLHDALDYVYSPDYFSEQRVPESGRLEAVFSAIRDNRNRNQIIITRQTPYISSWYRRVVLDNLTVSGQKLNIMEEIFLGAEPVSADSDFLLNDGVVLTGINAESKWNDSTGVFQSRIDLEIANQGASVGLAEYVTEFELPDGCFIMNYDLVIEGKREPGLLVEKRSALWVFSMIRQVQRDPGVLWYKTGNRIGFHIYPFSGGEIRQTGIEL
ncbi:MAG: MSEP-CTERM sorting domain-containing protein, partial [Bacteroidales bacterium]